MSSNEFKIIFEDRDGFLLVEKYVPENQICVSVDDGGMIINTTISPADAIALADAIYEAEGRGWKDVTEYYPNEVDYYQVTVMDMNTGETWADHWRYALPGGWVPSDDAQGYMAEFNTEVKAIAYREIELYQPEDTDD